MATRSSVTAVVLAYLAALPALWGDNGDLDPTFGAGGLATTDFGANDVALEAVQQSDGKWVVAGDTTGQIAIARYLPNGLLDTSFGGGGGVRTPVGAFANTADLAVVDGGKILVAGTTLFAEVSNEFLLLRYLADGTFDPDFGTGGGVIVGVGATTNDRVNAMAVGPDGKVVLVGRSDGGFAMARFDANGSLDTDFGTGGWVQTPIGTGDDEAYDVALQVDGKIVVAGEAVIDSVRVMAVARYLPDGDIDLSFGEDGLLLGNFEVEIRSVAVQDDGRILVAGTWGGNFYLIRFLEEDGTIDESLQTGAVTVNFGQDDKLQAMAIQPDGKIVLVGTSSAGGNDSVAIARLRTDGFFDESFFGVGGLVLPGLGSNITAHAVALEAGAKILVAGSDGNAGSRDFLLLRFQSSLQIGPPQVGAISVDAERVVLDWLPFGDGRNYTVEQSDGLGVWTAVGPTIANGKTLAVLSRPAGAGSAFRVRSP